jgi:hypothetical protein
VEGVETMTTYDPSFFIKKRVDAGEEIEKIPSCKEMEDYRAETNARDFYGGDMFDATYDKYVEGLPYKEDFVRDLFTDSIYGVLDALYCAGYKVVKA